MATILIVEHDEQARRELRNLDTPHELVCVESAQKAWSLVEAGFTFDDVIFFADPVAEALLQSAAIDHDADPDSEVSAFVLAAFDHDHIERAA